MLPLFFLLILAIKFLLRSAPPVPRKAFMKSAPPPPPPSLCYWLDLPIFFFFGFSSKTLILAPARSLFRLAMSFAFNPFSKGVKRGATSELLIVSALMLLSVRYRPMLFFSPPSCESTQNGPPLLSFDFIDFCANSAPFLGFSFSVQHLFRAAFHGFSRFLSPDVSR